MLSTQTYLLVQIISLMKKIHFIANPFSGNTIVQKLSALVNQHFDKTHFDCQIKHTQYAGHATLLAKDVWTLAIVSAVCLGVVFTFWKEFKILLFDEAYAQTLGFDTKKIDIIVTSFIVLAIILGLQTVGVILMSSMLLAPAAAARQWTNSLGFMVLLAAIFGAFSGVFGTAISASQNNLSTGPVIVLVAAVFVVFSFIFSPSRGLLFKQIRFIKNRRDLELHKTLAFMYGIAETHENISHPHAIKILNNFQGYTKSTLQKLVKKDYVKLDGNMWHLTEEGFKTAANLYNQQSNE